MLTIIVPGQELFNEETREFINTDDVELVLEHSLISLSKWESKFQKPFLGSDEKSFDELYGYVKAMILTENVPDDLRSRLTQVEFDKVKDYLESSQSATTFGSLPEVKARRGEIITSELIYYWMVAFNIPFKAETWHLNRLLSLIRICNIKNSKPKRISRTEMAQRNKMLNDQRRAQLGTTG